jgi:hypothetical protein
LNGFGTTRALAPNPRIKFFGHAHFILALFLFLPYPCSANNERFTQASTAIVSGESWAESAGETNHERCWSNRRYVRRAHWLRPPVSGERGRQPPPERIAHSRRRDREGRPLDLTERAKGPSWPLFSGRGGGSARRTLSRLTTRRSRPSRNGDGAHPR